MPSPGEELSFLCGDWRLFQPRRGHRWSLDDLVTGWVAARQAEASSARTALDLGCGLGSVLLMLAWRRESLDVTGVEAQATRAALARRSIAWNGVEARCRVLDGDLRDAALLEGARFELVTGTPPYFPAGTGTEPAAAGAAPCRFERRGGPEAYLEAAARHLAPGGRAVLCASALQRERLEGAARALGLAAVERLEIVPREGRAALLTVDVFAREAATPREATLVVRDREGQWTPAFLEVRRELGLPPRPR